MFSFAPKGNNLGVVFYILFIFYIVVIKLKKNCDDILKEGDIIEIKEGELPIPPKKLTYRIVEGVERLTSESLEEMARQARLHAYHLCLEESKEEPEHE
jgi:signal peptidase I